MTDLSDFFTLSDSCIASEQIHTTESEEDVERRIKEENDAYIKNWRKELSEFLAARPGYYPDHVEEVLLRKLANDEDIYCDDLY